MAPFNVNQFQKAGFVKNPELPHADMREMNSNMMTGDFCLLITSLKTLLQTVNHH